MIDDYISIKKTCGEDMITFKIIMMSISGCLVLTSIILAICSLILRRKAKKLRERSKQLEAQLEELTAELEELKWKSEEYTNYYGSYYACDGNEDIRYS